MFSLQQLVRPNIWDLKPYSSARSEFTGSEGIFLDANENPYGRLNRYPDPLQQKLKEKIAAIKSVSSEKIFIGNGSDEIIDLAFRIFCEPGKDKAVSFYPTYGMYEITAGINDIALIQLPLNEYFQVDFDLLAGVLEQEQPKLLLLCSPNNPTGNCIDGVEQILQKFKGIVILDEAYIDFADRPSFSTQLDRYPNLIVLQTLSKAWGLAAARVGIAFAQPELIALLNKVKPPYNISSLNQEAALQALTDRDTFEENKTFILQQRAWLEMQLKRLTAVKKIYPSDANFLLVKMDDAGSIYRELLQRQVITRNRQSQVDNCIRITVGKPEENLALVKALQEITRYPNPQTIAL